MSKQKTARNPRLIRLQARSSPSRTDVTDWIIVAILVLATVATFCRACFSDFNNWDDPVNVSKNPYFNPVTLKGVFYFWQHPHASVYIPLTDTVWGILAAIARLDAPENGVWLNPWIFHTANVLLHAACAVLAYQFLRVLSGNKWAACLGALLFSVHPVQVESVAWIAGMRDVLSGAFCLASLWQYVLYARQPSRRVHYWIATIAFVLAMLSKPTALVLPFMAATIDFLLIRRQWKQIAFSLLPWLALSIGCAILARAIQHVAAPADGGHLWARPLLASEALAFYVGKILSPAHLAVLYHFSPQVLLASHRMWILCLIPLVLCAAALGLWKRAPWFLAGCLLALFAVLPVLGLVPFEFERLSLVADHYLYLAMIGPSLILTFLLARKLNRPAPIVITAMVLVTLAVRSFLQTGYWHDTVSLFLHELEVNPSSEVAYNNLADDALSQGHPLQAEQLARQSLACQPLQADANITLGRALARQGKLEDAFECYQRAVEINPDNPVALSNLAGLLAMRGRIDQAMPMIRRSLQLDPMSASAHRNLAVMLANQRMLPDALREAQIAVALDPMDVDGQVNLAVLLAQSGQRAAALKHASEALRLQPDSPKVRNLMAALSH